MRRPMIRIRHRILRVALVTALLSTVISVAAPQAARASTTTTLELVTRSFAAPNGYTGSLVVTRDLSERVSVADVVLDEQQTVTTAGGQSEDAEQLHEYDFNWNGGLSAKPDLSSGKAKSGTQMGSFGAVNMAITALKPQRVSRRCGGRYFVTSRVVVLRGTFRFLPDAVGRPFFGTISFSSIKGVLYRIVDKTGGRGCTPRPCPSGVQLEWIAADGTALFAAGMITVAGSTDFEFGGLALETRAPASFILHALVFATPDTSAFSSQPDLSGAHLDTRELNLTAWVDGVTDYTAAGSAQNATVQCTSTTIQSAQFTTGTLSAPITLTFEGFGQVSNDPATDTSDQTGLLSVAPAASASAARALSGPPAGRTGLRRALVALGV